MFIVNGFLLGLTTGIFCLTWCIPVLLPLILSGKRKIKQSFFIFFEFVFGRLIGAALFGGLIGYLGLKIESEIIRTINLIVMVFLAILLIFYGIGWLKQKKIFCQFFKKIKFPALLGFLIGVNICPPFLLALTYVFNVGGVGKGILFFISFSLATSLYLVPFVFLGFLGSRKIFQKIARIIAVFVGVFFLIYGLRGLFSFNPCSACPLNYQNQIGNYLPLIIFCLLFFIAILLFFIKDRRNFLFRNLILLFSLIYFGFILKNAFCPIRTFQFLFIDGSKIAMSLISFLFFLLPIVLVLLIKSNVYCNWLCPLGAFQEFIFQAKKPIKCKHLSKDFLPKGKWRVQLKYYILIIIIFAVLILRKPILCGIDPFGALFGRFIAPASLVFLIVLIVLSVFIYRPWCQFFCPYGALLSLLSKLSFFKKFEHGRKIK